MVKRDLYINITIIGLIIGILVLLRIFLIEPIRIHNNNMGPALSKSEQVIAVNTDKLENLDMVAYRHDGKKYIGRVIGLPGQEVDMLDDLLYVDGKVIEEPYIKSSMTAFLKKHPDEEYNTDFNVASISGKHIKTVPDNSYIILNDDRQVEDDSRKFGFINKSDIYGVITFKYYPFKDFGFVQNDESKIDNGFKEE